MIRARSLAGAGWGPLRQLNAAVAVIKVLPLADAEDNRRYLTSPDATMPGQIQRLADTMTRAGLLTHPAPPGMLLDTGMARRVLHQGTT